MGNNIKKILAVIGLALALNAPLLVLRPVPALAQSKAAPLSDADRCAQFKKQFELTNNTNVIDSSQLPIYCSASGVITQAINYALAFAGTVTILFLMVGGFWYLTSAGDEEQAEKGRKTIVNSIIGLVVIILSYTIVRIVANLLTLGKGS